MGLDNESISEDLRTIDNWIAIARGKLPPHSRVGTMCGFSKNLTFEILGVPAARICSNGLVFALDDLGRISDNHNEYRVSKEIHQCLIASCTAWLAGSLVRIDPLIQLESWGMSETIRHRGLDKVSALILSAVTGRGLDDIFYTDNEPPAQLDWMLRCVGEAFYHTEKAGGVSRLTADKLRIVNDRLDSAMRIVHVQSERAIPIPVTTSLADKIREANTMMELYLTMHAIKN